MTDKTVGSYRLIEKLGEGGMGEVYLADHKYIARRAAIKFLLRDLSSSADLVGRFFAEARAASVIKHPGIVEVLDCDVHDDGRAYIVMELLRGESLRDYIERVRDVGRDENGALAIFRQIASALAAAHAQEIIHRDLKPDNVFLHLPEAQAASQPIVKVLDFGIAKLMGRGGEGGTKTRTGQLLGTPMYMSPEQCRGAKQIDSRSDIYSLGCIMYEVMCGRPPFVDEGFGDLIIAHVSHPPPEPLQMAPWMTEATRQILLSCLAKDPRDRPQSMQQVAIALVAASAPEIIDLRNPVSPEAAQRRRAEGAAESHPPGVVRLAPTTPMSNAPARSGAAMRAPSTPPPTMTPSGVGRTRFLPKSDPNTLHEGASESFPLTVRSRGSGGKWAIGLGSVGAVALAAVVILRTVAAPTASDATGVLQTAPASGATSGATSIGTTSADHGSARTAPAGSLTATSTISLEGLPPNAIVHLDCRIVSPPVKVPRLPETHHLLVEAAGYQSAEMSLDGDNDRTVAVAMTKLAAAPVPRSHAFKTRKKIERPPHESPGFKAFTDL